MFYIIYILYNIYNKYLIRISAAISADSVEFVAIWRVEG